VLLRTADMFMRTASQGPLRVFATLSFVEKRANHTTSAPIWPAAGARRVNKFALPCRLLTVTGLDNRLALALFVLGTVVGSIVVEGNQWLKRWITTSDPDR
jgi:hypothetical protein